MIAEEVYNVVAHISQMMLPRKPQPPLILILCLFKGVTGMPLKNTYPLCSRNPIIIKRDLGPWQ